MTQFEVGKTYSTRSICDYECIFSYTVISRTEKTITIQDKHGKIKTCRPYIYENSEQIKPEGSYSMCPILRAERWQ